MKTDLETLVDTGAKLSCTSEELLECNELFRNVKIRKTARRAYGVNGEPVVTLGVAELTFKIGGLEFTHQFTVLRGLIHPMLIGMDFLVKYKARIDLGEKPRIQLSHPSGKHAFAPFIKAMPKPKPATHIALMKEIVIPPQSCYYADAYIANVEEVKELVEEKPTRLIGITSVQKVNDFFDPGFVLRDAVISAEKEFFKVELMNPWQYPLKLSEATPVGMIFDYDMEIMETDGDENTLWEEEPENESEKAMRRQTLLAANISVIEVDQLLEENACDGGRQEWKSKPPDKTTNTTTTNKTTTTTTTNGIRGGRR